MFLHGSNPISSSSVKLTKKGHTRMDTPKQGWTLYDVYITGNLLNPAVGRDVLNSVSLLSGLTNNRQINRYLKEFTTSVFSLKSLCGT